MAALVTLIAFLIIGVSLYVVSRSRKAWGPALGRLATGDPDSLNARLQAERAVPRPLWPIDEDGNPIDVDGRG
ncbi:hypothetical protein [Mycobacterium sp. D16R24]|uniref:hypothetical protein n=1 Tax=Mycobacterium sp. D16R24 TaxID=1855656 RepID=UPI000993B056|nr:hypothetical protein [Mycobacterium sp. D16R24]